MGYPTINRSYNDCGFYVLIAMIGPVWGVRSMLADLSDRFFSVGHDMTYVRRYDGFYQRRI
jgi:hypothetical protein